MHEYHERPFRCLLTVRMHIDRFYRYLLLVREEAIQFPADRIFLFGFKSVFGDQMPAVLILFIFCQCPQIEDVQSIGRATIHYVHCHIMAEHSQTVDRGIDAQGRPERNQSLVDEVIDEDYRPRTGQ